MIQLQERVQYLLSASIETKIMVADALSPLIAKASARLVQCLLNDGKIMVCGNGGSAANGLHFSAVMLHHLDIERPPLPVITLSTDMPALTAMANEGHAEQLFARQIQALGQAGDVLLALSASGNASNVLHAVHAAHERDMDVIALSGRDGGVLANHLGPEDSELRVPSDSTPRIWEMHLAILYCFCDLIEQSLFGQLVG